VAAIRSNLAALKIQSGFEILSSTVPAALRRPTERSRWSVVFLDPPYAADNDYAATLSGIGHDADSLLTQDGIVIAEHSRKMVQPLAESYGPLKRYRVLEQGDAGLSFYTR
jgi:16S rRNA G966 N2-methylase RsmD